MQPIYFIQQLYLIRIFCFKENIQVFTTIEPAGDGAVWIVFRASFLRPFLFQRIRVREILAEYGSGGFFKQVECYLVRTFLLTLIYQFYFACDRRNDADKVADPNLCLLLIIDECP